MQVSAVYRGYTIKIHTCRVAYMTMYVWSIYTSRGKFVQRDDGGFDTESALRSARSYIDKL
jgi:hypothetical protein